MTVAVFKEKLGLQLLAGESGLEKEVQGCYIGDLLSWVMGRAGEGDAWITVMGNINAVAVAKLADAACLILCEGAHLDENAKARADMEELPILCGSESGYRMAVAVAKLLGDAS